ncbi:MAG TPA: hypothetical protein VK119_03465 [Bacillota bacterium]|nr:hypothetical protein [Bacillota bacterium]
MAKRKWKMFLVAFGLILLVSCKPSDKYTGDWYAVSASGDKVMINFSKEKVMTLSDEEGNEEVYEMNQTASGIQNSTRYFRVEIDGASHYVVFENNKDEDHAQLVKQTNHASDFEDVVGEIIYKMNRNDFPTE